MQLALKLKNSKGFTLIELLTVIAIIALLAGIILASLNTARQKSRDAKRVSDIKNLELALSLYYNDNNFYPAVLSQLTPQYISVKPTDPSTGNDYLYAGISSVSRGTCSGYHLGANLEQNGSSALSSATQSNASQTVCSNNNQNSVADFSGSITRQCDNPANTSLFCYDVHS